MVAGTRPLSAQEVLGILTPWLSGKLTTPQMPSVKSVRVQITEDPDVGFVIASAPFTRDKLYQVNGPADTIVTGIKWNLRSPTHGAITDTLASDLRGGFRSTGRQGLERLGFKILLSSIHPYGQLSSRVPDYGIPPTPVLPPMPEEKPKPAPQPKVIVQPQPSPAKTAAISWAFGAIALIAVAYFTTRMQKRAGALGTYDPHGVKRRILENKIAQWNALRDKMLNLAISRESRGESGSTRWLSRAEAAERKITELQQKLKKL